MDRESHVLVDVDGNSHDIASPNFDLDELRKRGLMPGDYEICGTCGLDHAYDRLTEREIRLHVEAGDMP
jgi:hypothetical protein